jgi:hypothetical protein
MNAQWARAQPLRQDAGAGRRDRRARGEAARSDPPQQEAETMTRTPDPSSLRQTALAHGLHSETLRARLRTGWSLDRALWCGAAPAL